MWLNLKKKWLNPMNFSTNAMFIVCATLFLVLISCLIQVEMFPSLAETTLSQHYSPWETLVPIKIWMQLAVISTLILPIFILLVYWRTSVCRHIMLLYVGIMLVQITTEIIFSNLGFANINYVIGFIYTSYRLWQLLRYKEHLRKQKIISGIKQRMVMTVIIGGIVFWTLNDLFLGINIVTRIIGS